jgi:hypothetical protein
MTVSMQLLEGFQVINSVCVDNMFHFTCFNVEDPSDPSVGLIDGQLCIPGNLLRERVFDPVVSQVSILSISISSRYTSRHRSLL